MKPASFTPQELLKAARPLGVTRVVLIQHIGYYGYDNRYITDAIRQFPGVFSAVAAIGDAGKKPADEMRRLKKLGVRGGDVATLSKAVQIFITGSSSLLIVGVIKFSGKSLDLSKVMLAEERKFTGYIGMTRLVRSNAELSKLFREYSNK